MSDVVVRLERRKVEALLAFGDTSFGPLDLDDAHDEALAQLRAALDSPPVEEERRYQVAADQGLVVHPDEADEMGLEEVREIAEEYAKNANVTNVRVQTCAVLTGPWVDLASEEGERG